MNIIQLYHYATIIIITIGFYDMITSQNTAQSGYAFKTIFYKIGMFIIY